MNLGFTGTRRGCTEPQLRGLRIVFEEGWRTGPHTLHHGDCIGADKQAHRIARELSWRIVGHPPENYSKRAMCKCDELRPEKSYLCRNREIVLETQALVACPQGPEQVRSGTWYTVRFARLRRRPIYIIWPDGRITTENVK